jgi:NAD(P)H-quinone oxidoreductase subunit 5
MHAFDPIFDTIPAGRLTVTLLLLAVFLFAMVARYTQRYLHGDPGQARFTLWLWATGASVVALVAAPNFWVFAAAWCGTSLGLHQLLQHYRERPGAVLAARKKFLISRVGDASLAGGIALLYREFGTGEFRALETAAGAMAGGVAPVGVVWAGVLIALAAMLKSAQFPFHTWLPDTMETPTPVSALMHAGIINAGGILLLRLHAVVGLSEPAMTMLAVVGGFTALFAATVMLTQASVKRRLAFSTVGQMGFMMLECGLGAFHLALLHLVAHSLYKAFAFLSAGGAVEGAGSGEAAVPRRRAMAAGLVVAAGLTLAASVAVGVSPLAQPVLTGIFTLALAQMLWSYWTVLPGDRWMLPAAAGVAVGGAAAAGYFALDHFAAWMVTPGSRHAEVAGAALLGLFAVFAAVQTRLGALSRTEFGQRIYVHARNGFYFNTLANRMTMSVWPVQLNREVR